MSSAIGVLLDIEMPLVLHFGRTKMHLDDVLVLEHESSVELDRSPTDPVDVLVNGKLVARGHVVCVNGNYAVQVSEIASRRERLNITAGAV